MAAAVRAAATTAAAPSRRPAATVGTAGGAAPPQSGPAPITAMVTPSRPDPSRLVKPAAPGRALGAAAHGFRAASQLSRLQHHPQCPIRMCQRGNRPQHLPGVQLVPQLRRSADHQLLIPEHQQLPGERGNTMPLSHFWERRAMVMSTGVGRYVNGCVDVLCQVGGVGVRSFARGRQCSGAWC